MICLILITGGERSGKSSYALKMGMKLGKKRAFIATAEAIDDEMKKRIKTHKLERGDLFDTFEEPIYLDEILQKTVSYDVRIVECLTTWLGNLIYKNMNVGKMEEKFISSLSGNEIIVTNEVGMGIVPVNAMTRRYVEKLGRLNTRVANLCNEVYFMVSGIAVKIK
jgi:adenosylcobinamide kinase/adenosylcobinamide-phosphate guanylyltransferase